MDLPDGLKIDSLYARHIVYAKQILQHYKGLQPFHLFLKSYFASHKKHGSRDRKLIRKLCYDFFRLGHGVSKPITQEVKLKLGIYVCESETKARAQRLENVSDIFCAARIFSAAKYLSEEIDIDAFSKSFLLQPAFYLRIRPRRHDEVIAKLKAAGLAYQFSGENCLALENGTSIEKVLDINKEVVVQDQQSQEIGNFFKKYRSPQNEKPAVWDCCAGSGGKSILMADMLDDMELTVSDVRKSILKNLQERFREANIQNYQSKRLDLSIASSQNLPSKFDTIIADVPCTGSGTWGRTPESLIFFEDESLKKYVTKQRQIVLNAASNLKQNGVLFYITCSVFRQENEEICEYFAEIDGIDLLESAYLKGYSSRADTLYIAVFRKA